VFVLLGQAFLLLLMGCATGPGFLRNSTPAAVESALVGDAAETATPSPNKLLAPVGGVTTRGSAPEEKASASPPVPASEEGLPQPATLAPPSPVLGRADQSDLSASPVVVDSTAGVPLPVDPRSVPGPPVWGIVSLEGFPYGEHVASNGVEFRQLFSLGLDFNIWLLRQHHVYAYSDSQFWGQKAAPGITNPSQGQFDFSKREFDLTLGGAWNYYGNWEGRVFAYSYNNLNRGSSQVAPSGFNDGVGVENRYYLGSTYADLGTAAFDKARATFLSLGFYPTKSMVDPNGEQFSPGMFARAYLTLDLFGFGERCYLFTDDQLITTRGMTPEMFITDTGLAVRPFIKIPRLEFRVGSQDSIDLHGDDLETSAYLSVRYIY
jgi:hypothetical protein